MAENITEYDKYLTGLPRRPFNIPKRYLIMVIVKTTENWMDTTADVLKRLWDVYGICHIISLAPYLSEDEPVLNPSTMTLCGVPVHCDIVCRTSHRVCVEGRRFFLVFSFSRVLPTMNHLN